MPPNSSKLHLHPIPNQICFQFYRIKSCVLPMYSWVYGCSLERSQSTRGYRVKKDNSLPKQLSITYSYSAKGGTLCPFLSMLEFYLTWARAGLVLLSQSLWVHMCSLLMLPRRHWLCVAIHWFWLSQSFCKDPQGDGVIERSHLWLSTINEETEEVSYSLHPDKLWISVLIIIIWGGSFSDECWEIH